MIEIGIIQELGGDILIGLTHKRELAGFSQRKLSALSGVPQPMISDIENGKTKSPTVDTAIKLSKALGCTVEELVSERKEDCSNYVDEDADCSSV